MRPIFKTEMLINQSKANLDCVHTMPAQFENGRKFDDKNCLQDLMPKKCTYTLRIDLSRSISVEKFLFSSLLSVNTMLFQIYAGYGSVFKIYRFQNLPAKNVPFSCEREAYPSNFSPFSKCAGIV